MQQDHFELEITNRKVNIVRIQKPSGQGRQKHTREGHNMKKTQSGKAGTKWAIPDTNSGERLNTGFWKLRTNPFYNDKNDEHGEKRPVPALWANYGLEKSKYITWQTYFEIMHNVPQGHYTSERASWLAISTDKKFKPTALQSFRFKFIDGTTVLDLTKPKHQLMYFFALQSPNYFCSNILDIPKFPRASFLIQELNAPAEEEFKSNMTLADTMYNLKLLSKDFGSEILKKFGVVLKQVSYNESYETAFNAIQNSILANRRTKGEQLTFIEQFNNLYELLNRDGGRARFNDMYLLQELINCNIIGDTGGTYIWYNKKGTELEIIGKSKGQALAWLADEEKAIYRQELEELWKSKKVY